MSAPFELDLHRAQVALTAMRSSPDGRVGLSGDAWAQAAMETLVRAELLAAQAGVVPWFVDPETGERGILTVGAAREHMDQAPEDVRTMYLGTHALVRQTHAMAAPWKDAPLLGTLEPPRNERHALAEIATGVVVVIALVAVAVAAIVATAWYFDHHSTVEVEGKNLRTTAIASALLETAREQLATTGQIDPKLWEVFKALAENERETSWVPYAIGGAIVVAGAGTLAYAWYRHRKHAAELARAEASHTRGYFLAPIGVRP
jgi:hypothetical protein